MFFEITLWMLLLTFMIGVSLSLWKRNRGLQQKDMLAVQNNTLKAAPMYLLLGHIFLRVFALFLQGVETGFVDLFANGIYFCVYYAFALAVLPLVRKHCSAGACSSLWIFPVFLPILFREITRERLYLLPAVHIPIRLQTWMVAVWAFGFIAILLWYLVSHLVMRHRILRNAIFANSKILESWESTCKELQFTGSVAQPMRSPDITTPLCIGLFRTSMQVILPTKDYTPDELRMIFRHELIHIVNYDCTTKFLLCIITALFWFNPLQWIALARCTEDLELSCDETVLADADENIRYQYATLLLHSAATPFGFTSCLSATSHSLRYRLKNALQFRKKRSGCIVVALLLALFFGLLLYVPLAYDHDSGQEYILCGAVPEACTVTSFKIQTTEQSLDYRSAFENSDSIPSRKICEYLSGLTLFRLSRAPEYADGEGSCSLNLSYPGGSTFLMIQQVSEDYTMIFVRDNNQQKHTFYCEGTLQWEYLLGLLENYEPEVEAILPAETQPKDPPPLPSHK